MKRKSEILNIPAIQKSVKNKHLNFIEKYQNSIEKVISDHKLFADITLAKLHRLLLIFKEESVIDNIQIIDRGPYKKIVLSKNGYDTYVELETNGLVIVFQGYTYTAGSESDFRHQKKIIRNITADNFDWVEFCDDLVDYIHNTIYERKEAVEQRLKGIFKDIPNVSSKMNI